MGRALAGAALAVGSGMSLEIRVVDATENRAAAGLRVELYCLGEHAAKLCSAEVDALGRVDDPVLEGEAILPGEYEVVFHVGEFFRRRGFALPSIPFIDIVPFRFGIPARMERCTLPVRVSPWSFEVDSGAWSSPLARRTSC